MKMIDLISENENFTAVNIGRLDNLMDYSIIHLKSHKEVKGKVFLKDTTKSTGTEISFQILQPKAELGYFHTHIQNEETYIIIKGTGEFQVDDQCFPIAEGSVVRIAPGGKRSMRNSSGEPMVYMVVQSKAGSLSQYSMDDGERVDCEPIWK
ncbi:mannose-6-phosphate isomerase-like protein (cupin superfamily) [Dysgonomonas hofstadii]|uniref:Mannose-6-phosphate isomerase-like protein (Cupin superfamily) n=1 Tax=Dysgonomonas hofstadii TaxID=637886 RepID=A0A840CJL1_9BACT|nr:cupin domain-containing protein [Dysgonomonas hofstadii]MBB4035556.1 mannose-6-phosphate isomerase-like protein (cupin superfamily) [Dysgonomonas hofstadii]